MPHNLVHDQIATDKRWQPRENVHRQDVHSPWRCFSIAVASDKIESLMLTLGAMICDPKKVAMTLVEGDKGT